LQTPTHPPPTSFVNQKNRLENESRRNEESSENLNKILNDGAESSVAPQIQKHKELLKPIDEEEKKLTRKEQNKNYYQQNKKNLQGYKRNYYKNNKESLRDGNHIQHEDDMDDLDLSFLDDPNFLDEFMKMI